MKVDQDLRDLIAAGPDPEATVAVVLCARADAEIGEEALARCGFKFHDRQAIAAEVFIHGEIKLKDIDRLSAIAGIEAVSSAPDVEIF